MRAAERAGFEPACAFWTRRFSKPLVLATHPPLHPPAHCMLSAPELPLQGSNLDFPDPESGVLPITPRGNNTASVPTATRSPFRGLFLHGQGDPSRAGDGARTRDPQLGKLMLCQLSYSRRASRSSPRRRTAEPPPQPPCHPEPPVGFEPTTARLRIECSTPELRWHRPPDLSTRWSRGESNP